MSSKQAILKKTAAIGSLTLMSRFFGIIREVLMVRYLGPTALSDVFLTAFKIPNSLRKIFAEGALSAALVPSLVHDMKKGGADRVRGLLMVSFLFFESFVLLLCLVVMVWPGQVLGFIAPGFSPEAIQAGIPFLRILMPFIFFLSCSAVMGGALHAAGHFFTPAFSPILLNLVFITGIAVCLWYDLPIVYLCWFIFVSGVMQLLLHVISYWVEGFSFGRIAMDDIRTFWNVAVKFLLCLPTISIMELNLFIDTSFASYLPAGQISLIHYANRFAGIPIGIFAVAFSTILLPHFSRVAAVSRRRLPFYLFESLKFIFWLMIPTSLLMAFFSQDIFYTIFLSKKFTLEHVVMAGKVLSIFVLGLFSFSANKIVANMFYAIHKTWVPALIACVATMLNVLFNWFFLSWLGIYGLALATSLSALIQTGVLLYALHRYYQITVYGKQFFSFILHYTKQLLLIGSLFCGVYYGFVFLIHRFLPEFLQTMLLKTVILWMWVGPLTLGLFGLLWITRSWFNVRVYFLN